MKAIFLDRDGVINRNVFYSDSGAYESPRTAAAFDLFPDALLSLQELQGAGYKLFLVSNQPNVAKGKSTLDELLAIQEKLKSALDQVGVNFAKFYCCYHHPDSTVPIYGGPCVCRKPSPYFLRLAEVEHSVDLSNSWMVGDRMTDIECGYWAGVRTILIDPNHEHSVNLPIGMSPMRIVSNLGEATRYILGLTLLLNHS